MTVIIPDWFLWAVTIYSLVSLVNNVLGLRIEYLKLKLQKLKQGPPK